MSKTNLNFEIDVRIPSVLVQQMMDGEITCAMLVTMTILYKWAAWGTGRVRWCSAGGLRTASRKAYSERTFQECLRKLEEMGWITRLMTRGSHEDYPVIIHNYKVTDDAGKVHILNPKDIKVCDPFETGACREASDETSYEGSGETSGEASYEGSDKDKHNTKQYTERGNKHDTERNIKHNNVSLSVSQSKRADALDSEIKSCVASDLPSEKTNPASVPQDFVDFSNADLDNHTLSPEQQEQVEAIGNNQEFAQLLGLPYLMEDHQPEMKTLAVVLSVRGRTADWLTDMLKWIKGGKTRESKFWGTRIHTGTRGLKQLSKAVLKGELCQQFDSHLTATKGDASFKRGNSNYVPQYRRDSGKRIIPGKSLCWDCGTLHEDAAPCPTKQETTFGAPMPVTCALHREELLKASRMADSGSGDRVSEVMLLIHNCPACAAVNSPEPGSMAAQIAKNQAKAAAANVFDAEEA
jgi:hypothetical protein